MLFEIRRVCRDIVNSQPWGIPVKRVLKFSGSSLACASLAQRMWITAKQLIEDPRAREQVFRAGQRLFALMEGQREVAINNFIMANRIGALALGLISAGLAMRGIMVIWNCRDRS